MVPSEVYGRTQSMVLQKMCSLITVVATTVVFLWTLLRNYLSVASQLASA